MPLIQPPGLILLGTPARVMNAHRRLHSVPAEIVRAGLRADLDDLAEGTVWYSVIALEDGKIACAPSAGARFRGLLVPDTAFDLMLRIATIANRDCHHDGHWIVAWAQDEIRAAWRDKNGDMEFTQEFADAWGRLARRPDSHFVEILEACHQKYREMIRELEIKPDQTFRRILGERAPSGRRLAS